MIMGLIIRVMLNHTKSVTCGSVESRAFTHALRVYHKLYQFIPSIINQQLCIYLHVNTARCSIYRIRTWAVHRGNDITIQQYYFYIVTVTLNGFKAIYTYILHNDNDATHLSPCLFHLVSNAHYDGIILKLWIVFVVIEPQQSLASRARVR